MQGPTLTMPPVFDATSIFPRSHSSPNIPDLVNINYNKPKTSPEEELPRSASFSCLPSPDGESEYKLHRVVSADVHLVHLKNNNDFKGPDKDISGQDVREASASMEGLPRPRMTRRKSLVARPKSWIQRVTGSSEGTESWDYTNTTPSNAPPVPQIPKPTRDKTKTVSESFASFARKSWISSSRSPSPSRGVAKSSDGEGEHDGGLKMKASKLLPLRQSNTSPEKLERSKSFKGSETTPKSATRTSSGFSKIKQRPQSVFMNFASFNSANSSTSSLQRSSMDNKSTPRTSTDKVPPLPKDLSAEKIQSLIKDTARRKDELWSAFRSLDNDFAKFQAKSWSLKTNVVRSALLPFLRNHADHPSNKALRVEDIDRRVNVLNKWWMGLLEVLDGRQSQAVSGVDRPVLLEAVVAIMTRPEWRLSPSNFAPLSARPSNASSDQISPPSRKSSVSLNSSATQFLAESVYHNIQTMFIQNLLTQMSYVVDKMSLRHAPASLVTFCGKAAAYAFFFVPGVAEALIRVWKLEAATIRRAADEVGLPRRPNKPDMDEVVAPFPPHIQSLGWTSVKSVTLRLRQKPDVPILVSKIPWYGPWAGRWCGRDSDLFFVFVKHYHILAEEFMPSELPLTSKARAPGFVLVQAQVLTALDATIHRQPPAEPLPITFDDVLAGADASAAAMPLPSNNSARPMAENRLIMLLRDFIADRPSSFEEARVTFAEAFGKMMQAAARKTSVFDHNACFVLCDFMEEALVLFVRFHHATDNEFDFIDWRFWLEVCKKILESQNTMSEIRLFAFMFGAWNIVINDERRKEILCLDWLLEEDTFNRFFLHWCPMVRAYYMRLLCWRLSRDDGECTALDTKIFNTISSRLKSCWAYYLFLKNKAEESRILPPSIAHCLPAPGRRLLIIRNDNQSPSTNLFLGFDGLLTPTISSPTNQSTSYKRHSSLAGLSKLDTEATPKLTSDPQMPSKKRWTLINRILPSALAPEVPQSMKTNNSPTKTLEDARKETAIARARPSLKSPGSSTDSETATLTSTHRTYSFKFSLEWAQHFDKPLPTNANPRNSQISNHGNERRLLPPRLPAPAQAWLGANVPNTNKEVLPRDPKEASVEKMSKAKYTGRALAEWGLIVAECNNFVERRRNEGVPNLGWVEVPTLGVEGFRRTI